MRSHDDDDEEDDDDDDDDDDDTDDDDDDDATCWRCDALDRMGKGRKMHGSYVM